MKITRTFILCTVSLLLVIVSLLTAPAEEEPLIPVSVDVEETSESAIP